MYIVGHNAQVHWIIEMCFYTCRSKQLMRQMIKISKLGLEP